LAYLERRALLALALLERQARWGCLVPPGLQELQALTELQVPPASLEFLVLLVQPGSTGQQVLLELLVSQERQALPELRAVTVLQVLKVLRERLVLPARMELAAQQELVPLEPLALTVPPEQLEPLAWELQVLLALELLSPSEPMLQMYYLLT
jgi:hypothetical protein